MILFALAMIAAADAAPQTVAQSAVDPAPATAAKPSDADNRIICKRVARTGTRLAAKRYCMTALDWRQTTERAQREVGDLKTHSQMERVPSF